MASSLWLAPCMAQEPYTYDTAHYSRLLQDNSKRIFAQEASILIKVIEVGVKEDLLFKDYQELDNYLSFSKFIGTRIIYVPQIISWDRLMISEKAMLRILSHLQVFPVILDVMNAFGRQNSSESDSYSACHFETKANITECCYVSKHVEEHGREDESETPWSIRQMGVYHHKNTWADTNTFIIFNPSKNFQRRLKDAQDHSESLITWRDIHVLASSCATTPWRRYIGDMEAQLATLKTKAHLSKVVELQPSGTKPHLKIEFSDTQNMQVIHDKLYQVKHILGSNLAVFNTVSELIGDKDHQAQGYVHVRGTGIFFCTMETKQQSQRLDTLLQRTNAASNLMQKIIDFRAMEALKTSSEMTTKISQLAQLDAQKSQKDARTITYITIFTLIFLPASFVSQFLSMGYIDIGSSHHDKVSLHFHSEMWIFGTLTLLLLLVTLGLWQWLEIRARRREHCEAASSHV